MAVSLMSLGLVLGGRAAAQEAPGLMSLPSSTATLPATPMPTLPLVVAPSLPSPTSLAPVAPPTPPMMVPDVSGPSVSAPPEPLVVPQQPAAPREKVLQFTREPMQPPLTPPVQSMPLIQPMPVTQPSPAAQALGTVQVSPAYTGPVAMPTTQPALEPGTTGAPMSSRQRKLTEEGQDYNIQLDFPGLGRTTRLESEAALKERMRNEFRRTGERITFPEEPVLAREPYQGRHWPNLAKRVEPHYVCYGRLHFEQPMSERYGWSFGAADPVVESLHFFTDVFLLPYHLGTRPFDHTECSAGRCLPGDAVPLALSPPQLSVTGLLAQTGAVVGGFFIFP